MNESTYNLLFALEKAALAFAEALGNQPAAEPTREPPPSAAPAPSVGKMLDDAIKKGMSDRTRNSVPEVVVTAPVSPQQAEPIPTPQPQPQVVQNPPRQAETAIQQQVAQVQTPEPAQPVQQPQLNLGQVQTFLSTLARGQQREGQQKIADIVYSFGSQRVSDIPPERYQELMDKVKQEFPNA